MKFPNRLIGLYRGRCPIRLRMLFERLTHVFYVEVDVEYKHKAFTVSKSIRDEWKIVENDFDTTILKLIVI